MRVLIADSFEKSGIDGLVAAGCEVVYKPELKERLFALGLEPAAEPLANTNAYIKSEIARWAKVVKAARIVVE